MNKNTLPNTPSDGGDTLQTHVLGTDDDYSMFFRHVNKCAGLTRKDIQYGLRVSATTADKWYSGELKNPLIRAREHVELLRSVRKAGCG